MKIGILYICTGKYTIFWNEFYQSAQQFLLPEDEKYYFVFSDGEINTYNNPNVTVIYQEKLGWPFDTLYRFKIFLKAEEQLKEMDFLYFFNANLVVKESIGREILPLDDEDLAVTLHPGFFDKPRELFTYETRKESTACITPDKGENYIAGGLNGGRAESYLTMIRALARNIDTDYKKSIIALWHDESHINHYILDKKVKILSPAYLYPEGWELPFEQKILILDKSKLGGHEFLRDETVEQSKFSKKPVLVFWFERLKKALWFSNKGKQ